MLYILRRYIILDLLYLLRNIMFSLRFWNEKLPEQGTIICHPGGQFDLSYQSSEPQVQTIEKAREIFQSIQKKGSLGFVLERVNEIGNYRIRVVPDTFMHNLNDLFQRMGSQHEEKRKQRTVALSEKPSDSDIEMVDAGNKRSRSLSHSENPPSKQRIVSKKAKAEKDAVLRDIRLDLIEALNEGGLIRNLSYAECCQIVEPDYAILVRNTLFPVHRSLLSYFPYWAGVFQSKMREAQEKYMVIKEVEPEDFVRILDWIYSGSLALIENPEGTPKDEEVNANIEMLRRVNQFADRFGLESLMATCSKMEQALHDKTSFARILQNNPLFAYALPAASDLFHDVHFRIGRKVFSGNRVLLASCSPYFRDLLLQAKDKGTKDNPIKVNVPAKFFPVWLKATHSRETVSLTLEELQSTYKFKMDDVFTFLKIFDSEGDYQSKNACCKYIWRNEYLSFLPEKYSMYFDYLHILAKTNDESDASDESEISCRDETEILADQKLKIRECIVEDEDDDDLENGVKEKFINWLQVHGKDIRRLSLVNCAWVDDALITCVAKNCPDLQSLSIDPSHQTSVEITDEALIALAKVCPQLKEFMLEANKKNFIGFRKGYEGITDKGISRLLEGCRHMQKLSLKNCVGITDKALHMIGKSCPDLQEIALSFTLITDQGLGNLLMQCQSLQCIEIEHCEKTTGAAIALIASNCPLLKKLNIASVPNIDEAVIRLLAQKCPELEVLN